MVLLFSKTLPLLCLVNVAYVFGLLA